MEHHDFITRTDNKSLFNQIKFLVTCAKESYQMDLNSRRQQLKELLDADEKIYEDEFIGKIKSRVDESIRERQRSLLAMKQERTKEIERLVASKKVHQNMQNCIEIRDELRRKDYRETQLCQLEQIDDRLRAIARERKDDEFWLNAQKRITDGIDRQQEREIKLKKDLQQHQLCILQKQLDEQRQMQQMDLDNVNATKKALDLKIKESVKADIEKARVKKLARIRDVKDSTNKICEQRKQLLAEAEMFEEIFHNETMKQVQKEMDEAMKKNAKVNEAVMDYLNYVRSFNNFQTDLTKRRDDIIDEMGRRFICYKTHPRKGIADRKRQVAESTHQGLLKQICTDQVRRAEWEAYQKENKIIENRFARLITRDKIKEREKIRKGLDMQLEVIHRLRAEKEMQFQNELNRAEEDRNYCQELLERHKAEGIDYLPPHPSWKLVACYKNDCKRAGGGDAK